MEEIPPKRTRADRAGLSREQVLDAALTLVDRDGAKPPNGGKLMFHKYGNQYFLSEILCSWTDMNVSVRPSKAEKRVQLQQAMVHPNSEVFIAAR